jgi:hypothetical protein
VRGRNLRRVAAAAVLVVMAAPAAAREDDVDVTALPLGKTVTTPTAGGLWTCQESFDANAAGAGTTGPWINSADGTYDSTKKTSVDGRVSWPDASFHVTTSGDTRTFTTNDLPTDHPTGVFPVASTDDAYQVDRNPNSITSQSITIPVPLHPKVASEPSCVGGEVGILKSGVALFDAVDAGGRDAVAYEVQDGCDGHPQMSGEYHYHSVSRCVLDDLDAGTGQSKLVGWAFDGFGIYGPRDAKGNELTSADLDECHGITSKVRFNGKVQKTYHYVATVDYPYTVGCFRGTSTVNGPTVPGGGGPGQGGPPPQP